jgi:hypothetical protein
MQLPTSGLNGIDVPAMGLAAGGWLVAEDGWGDGAMGRVQRVG